MAWAFSRLHEQMCFTTLANSRHFGNFLQRSYHPAPEFDFWEDDRFLYAISIHLALQNHSAQQSAVGRARPCGLEH